MPGTLPACGRMGRDAQQGGILRASKSVACERAHEGGIAWRGERCRRASRMCNHKGEIADRALVVSPDGRQWSYHLVLSACVRLERRVHTSYSPHRTMWRRGIPSHPTCPPLVFNIALSIGGERAYA